MSDDWWKTDPVVGASGPGQNPGNAWWASDPVVGAGQPSPDANVSIGVDVAKGGVTGLAKGTIGLAGMPVDTANAMQNLLGKTPQDILDNFKLGLNSKGDVIGKDPDQDRADLAAIHAGNVAPVAQIPGGAGDISNFVQKNVTGDFYQPKTGAGRFAELAGEVLPSVATGTEFRTPNASGIWSAAKAVGGDLRRMVLPSVAAAGGAEGADALGLPKAVGEIPALLAVKSPELLMSNPERMVRDRLGDMSEADIAQAIRLQNQGQTVGIPLMGQESFNNLGLQQLAGDVAASPTGSSRINTFLNARTPQIQTARGNMLDAIDAGDLGPQGAGDLVQQTADRRLRDLGTMGRDVASPGYRAAAPASIPDTELQRIVASTRAAAAQVGAGTTARRQLTALGDSLEQNGSNIGLLDSTRKSFRDNLTNAALPEAADTETAQAMRPILNDLRDTMAAHNPDYAAGLTASREAKQNIIQPVQNSPVGQIMAKTAEPNALTSAVSPARMNGPEVRDAFNELTLANPQAAPALTRLFARNATNVNATPSAASQMATALMGKPDTAQNFRAMLRGSELAGNQLPGTISQPVNQILDVMGATKRAPTIGSQTAGRTAANAEAGQSRMVNALDTDLASPLSVIGKPLQHFLQRQTYSRLADALTSPTSVQDLLSLARRQGVTPGDRATLSAALLGISQPADGTQQPR